ncbi:MAG: NADH-quinone oxidoreductase subunit N [Candidatus Bathyarchaeota archaeon]|nr:NADH-quinone oxidoreductase subunit N [Candidatus Bathyarchaeota archaeon]
MITLLDICLPTTVFVLSSILTIPAVKTIRNVRHRGNLLKLCWFSAVFSSAAAAVANLTLKYYSQQAIDPYVSLPMAGGSSAIFSSAFLVDAVSIYMAIIFMAVSAVTFMFSLFYIDSGEEFSERYYAVMLMVTGCVIGTVFAGDLLTMFIFWEATAAGSSFLVLYNKTPRSLHATLKYLIMIIIASAFIIYGLSVIYALTGTLNFWAAKRALMTLQDKGLLELAFAFMAAGYSIEAAAVPFHMWLPDAYAAAPSSSSAFLSALVDQGSYYVLLRVLIYILSPPTVLPWQLIFAVMSALTMIVGNLLALTERNVKRLVAYLCIVDVGYNLVAITTVTPLGIMGNLYFFLVGGISTAAAFMAVGILNRMGFKTLDEFFGVGRKAPLTSLALVLTIFSFIGVPSLAGFMAKYMVFTSAIEANLSWLAVIGVLTSVIQAAYLLKIVNTMYGKKPVEESKIKEPKRLLIPVFILVATLIVFGLYPAPILNLINPVIEQLTFIP